jgi:hypothetical protein
VQNIFEIQEVEIFDEFLGFGETGCTAMHGPKHYVNSYTKLARRFWTMLKNCSLGPKICVQILMRSFWVPGGEQQGPKLENYIVWTHLELIQVLVAPKQGPARPNQLWI